MKKILVFSDMHGEKKAVDAARKIVRDNDIDLVAYLGDFSAHINDSKANLEDAAYLIEKLSDLADVKALFGNCDSKKLRDLLDERRISMHNKVHRIGNAAIVGWGGSHPTPFDTPSEFSEEEIERSLDQLMKEAAKKKPDHTILLTHEPPAGTRADLLPVGNVGSKSIRRIIEAYQPAFNACGHIHEAKSVDCIGRTKIVNIGPASRGHFLAIYIGRDVETEDINARF